MVSEYTPPLGFRSSHLQTIYPTLFRKTPLITHRRERIDTPDGDFLDLDWSESTTGRRLAVLTHGLEGHSRGRYTQGMAAALYKNGWNVLSWNFRGCSGVPNRKLKSYHSGATEELQIVLDHSFNRGAYDLVCLIGFSLGGNLTLKYVGEKGDKIDPRIKAAVGISVPCDLESSAKRLETIGNRIYMRRFIRSLKAKVREKMKSFPHQLEDHGLKKMRTFSEFDEAYTAPIHGFSGAKEYWAKCSCSGYLKSLSIPSLILNALDDPFLTPACYPDVEINKKRNLSLMFPKYGGHLGFVEFAKDKLYWSERRTIDFLKEMAS